MSPINAIGLLASAAALTVSSAGRAESSLEDQNVELRGRIAELEKRLAAVESKDGQNWLTEQRADQVRALVQDMLADADTRSSLQGQGMTAGYKDGAILGSPDGNWLLRTNLLLQTRFELNAQRNVGPGVDNTNWGFEVTRAKFMLSGNVVDPSWFYRVDIETSGNAGGLGADVRTGLLNAYAGKDFGNGWSIYGGQYKAPLLYSEMVEAQDQQAVERSYLNYLFTGGYTQGIAFKWQGDQFRVWGNYNNGIDDTTLYGGTVATAPFFGFSPALAADTDYAFGFRGEWLAMGTWDQFNEYTSPRGEEMGILVGGAVQVQNGEGLPVGVAPPPTPTQLTVLTVDASAEFGGANVYGALIYANSDPSGGGPSAQPWGFQIGGGFYFDDTWELYGLYEYANTAGLAANGGDLNALTVGVNKYFMPGSQNAKWTTDVGFGFDTVPFAVPVTGWRADNTGEEGQFVLRSQLQILF